MWYAGSDATHHYFVVHVLDTWRSFRVPIEELTLEDVRLFQGYSRGTLYYAVQPGADFAKVEGVPPF